MTAGASGRGRKRRVRIDTLLVDRGLAESRSRAQALIMAGLVYAGEQRIDKAGQSVAEDVPIEVRGREHPWVSRGGVKLAHALEHFSIAVDGKTCLDVGASTGGFTDVLLQHGAAHVFAVDVGHGQLAWKLRNDPRVTVLERTNARHLSCTQVPDPVEVITCDASFIGLQTVLPAPLALAAPGACVIALIKPQFEVGRENVGKGGVVRDPDLHRQVCERIRHWFETLPGWHVVGLVESPLRGPEGNVEFLIVAERDA